MDLQAILDESDEEFPHSYQAKAYSSNPHENNDAMNDPNNKKNENPKTRCLKRKRTEEYRFEEKKLFPVCTLPLVELDCFLTENSGLLREIDNPENLCYFELSDIILCPPYSIKDLVNILEDPNTSIHVISAQKFSGDHAIRFLANYQSIQIQGELAQGLRHLQRKVSTEVAPCEQENLAIQKAEYCNLIGSVLSSFHKITPETILSGTHWLSGAHVKKGYKISLDEKELVKQKESDIKSKDQGMKSPVEIHKIGASKTVVPKIQENRQNGGGATEVELKSTKIDRKPKSFLVGGIDLSQLYEECSNDNGGEFGTTFIRLIAPFNQQVVDDPNTYTLMNLKVDSFVSSHEVFGLLMDPLDPEVVCYFKLQDLLLQPPFPFLDVVKLLTSPGISIRVTAAKKVYGANLITYFALEHAVILGGIIPPEQEHILKDQQPVSEGSDAKTQMQLIRKKLRDCRRAERKILLAGIQKTTPQEILSKKSPLATMQIDANFLWNQMTPNEGNLKVGGCGSQKNSVVAIPKDKVKNVCHYHLNNWVLDCLFDSSCGLLRCPDNPQRLCYFETGDWVVRRPFSYRQLLKLLAKPHIFLTARAQPVRGKYIEFCVLSKSISIRGQKQGDTTIIPEKGELKQSSKPMSRHARSKMVKARLQTARHYDLYFTMVEKIRPTSILSGAHRLASQYVDEQYKVLDISEAPPEIQNLLQN